MTGKRIFAAHDEALPESDERKRSQIPVRTTAALRAHLVQAAAAANRSLTQEIEQRLERTIKEDELRHDLRTSAFVSEILAEIATIEAATGKAWHADAETFGAVQYAVSEAIEDRMPIPPEVETGYRTMISAMDDAVLLGKIELEFIEGQGIFADSDDATRDKVRASIDRRKAAQPDFNAERRRLLAPVEEATARGQALYEEMRANRKAAQIARRRG